MAKNEGYLLEQKLHASKKKKKKNPTRGRSFSGRLYTPSSEAVPKRDL
jgi:hypothetical protein